jgi:hypothetical protein
VSKKRKINISRACPKVFLDGDKIPEGDFAGILISDAI